MSESTEVIEAKSKVGKMLIGPTKRLQRLVKSRYSAGILGLISFCESLLPLPILTDPFLVTAVLIDRERVRRMVLVTTLGSVVGGFVAFLIATFFREPFLAALSPDMLATINSFMLEEQGTFLLTIVGAITPVPYTIVAWAVALSSGNPLVFILASVVGRAFRYGIVGWSTYTFGPAALKYARRSLTITSIGIFILVGLYVWLKM